MAARDAHSLTPDQFRQCLRISLGSLIGFGFAHLTQWSTGLFFCVYPVLLLGMVPRFSAHASLQFVAASQIGRAHV